MSNRIYAPRIKHYIDWLGHIRYREYGDMTTYDERSYELLDELFSLIKKLEPVYPNGARELWLCAERGPIEAFGDYEEYLEEGMVSNYSEYVELWKDYFPDEVCWFNFGALEDEGSGYRAIFLGQKHVIEHDKEKEKSPFVYEITDLVEWMIESVKECITELEAGTYNERVGQNLPPQHRTGTISRKDWWDSIPGSREDFFEDLSAEEVQEFVRLVAEQAKDANEKISRCAEITVNDFLNCCALGYAANHYEGCELSPKEQYLKHADGRDDGLLEVDPDSCEAFVGWLHNCERHGGHPWEVCAGGNSTHIDLFVWHDESGFYLVVAGSAWTRTVEAVKFYLALKKAGWPVYIREGNILADRLLEKERIGIVPEGVFPAYCHSYFPNENVIDYKNLPYENRAEIASKCTWHPLTEVKLRSVQ